MALPSHALCACLRARKEGRKEGREGDREGGRGRDKLRIGCNVDRRSHLAHRTFYGAADYYDLYAQLRCMQLIALAMSILDLLTATC